MRKITLLALMIFFSPTGLFAGESADSESREKCETFEEDCERPGGNDEDEPTRPGNPDDEDPEF